MNKLKKILSDIERVEKVDFKASVENRLKAVLDLYIKNLDNSYDNILENDLSSTIKELSKK